MNHKNDDDRENDEIARGEAWLVLLIIIAAVGATVIELVTR